MYTVVREGEALTGRRIDTDIMVYAARDTPELRKWIATTVILKLTMPEHSKVVISIGYMPPFKGEVAHSGSKA